MHPKVALRFSLAPQHVAFLHAVLLHKAFQREILQHVVLLQRHAGSVLAKRSVNHFSYLVLSRAFLSKTF